MRNKDAPLFPFPENWNSIDHLFICNIVNSAYWYSHDINAIFRVFGTNCNGYHAAGIYLYEIKSDNIFMMHTEEQYRNYYKIAYEKLSKYLSLL